MDSELRYRPGRGSMVGGYRLEFPIGRGGSGTVWRARHAATGALAAVKVMRLRGGDSSAALKQRAHEAAVYARVASVAGAVHMLNSGGGRVEHVVMDYVDGVDLRWLLATGPRLSVPATLRIALDLARALAGVHAAGVVHGDIKPANLLVQRDGRARLVDFGSARIDGWEPAACRTSVPLTMAYAAPEVWLGRVEPRSDLYALGALLFECFAGVPPFAGGTGGLRRQHEHAAPAFAYMRPDAPREVIELIRACLQKEPARRPASAADCVAVLAAAAMAAATRDRVQGARCQPDRSRAVPRTSRGVRCMESTRRMRSNELDATMTLTLEQIVVCA